MTEQAQLLENLSRKVLNLIALKLSNGIDYGMFGLPNIQNVELTNEYFQRDEAFSLKDFTANSFGVFREGPIDVIWRFKPSAAKDAEEYLFQLMNGTMTAF